MVVVTFLSVKKLFGISLPGEKCPKCGEMLVEKDNKIKCSKCDYEKSLIKGFFSKLFWYIIN